MGDRERIAGRLSPPPDASPARAGGPPPPRPPPLPNVPTSHARGSRWTLAFLLRSVSLDVLHPLLPRCTPPEEPSLKMACSHSHSPDTQSALLQAILTELQQVKANQTVFESKVRSIAALLRTRTHPPSRETARIARSSPHFASESHRQHPAPRWTLVRGAGDASRQACRPPDFALARCAQGCRDRQVLAARDPHQCVRSTGRSFLRRCADSLVVQPTRARSASTRFRSTGAQRRPRSAVPSSPRARPSRSRSATPSAPTPARTRSTAHSLPPLGSSTRATSLVRFVLAGLLIDSIPLPFPRLTPLRTAQTTPTPSHPSMSRTTRRGMTPRRLWRSTRTATSSRKCSNPTSTPGSTPARPSPSRAPTSS